MKTISLVVFLLFASVAFGQYGGGISSQPQPYHPPENPAHASRHALAQEQYVVSGSTYSSARGEKPVWELPRVPEVPLGDVARTLKEEHAKLRKARFVYEN
jgi:hypothetical protein